VPLSPCHCATVSLCHCIRFIHHFDLKTFRPNEQDRVKVSLAAVGAFALIGWPLIIAKFGIMGWVNLWLMPWLGFHFWVSALVSTTKACQPLLLCAHSAVGTALMHWYAQRQHAVAGGLVATLARVGLCSLAADEHLHHGAPHGSPHPFQECQGVGQRQGAARGDRALRLPCLVLHWHAMTPAMHPLLDSGVHCSFSLYLYFPASPPLSPLVP